MSINYSIAGIPEHVDYNTGDWRNGELSPKFKDRIEDEIEELWTDIVEDIFIDFNQEEDESILDKKDKKNSKNRNWKLIFKELPPVKIHYNKNVLEGRLTEVGIMYCFDEIFPHITAYVELMSEENFFTFSKSFFRNIKLNYEGIETYYNGKSTVCDINNLSIKLSESKDNIHEKLSEFFSYFNSAYREYSTPEKFLFFEPREQDEE